MFAYLKIFGIKNICSGLTVTVFALLCATVFFPGAVGAHSESGDMVNPSGVVEMKPAAGDTHHLEVKPETLEGYRIPDMKITVKAIPQGGGPVIEKELEGMFGGNFHYGVNIALEPKKYLLKFHLDSPTFMREGARAELWLKPVDAEFTFDAAVSVEMSGKIGVTQTSDMKIAFEAEEAESMFVLPGGEDMHMGAKPAHEDDVAPLKDSAGMLWGIGILGIVAGFILGRFIFSAKLP